MLMDYFPGTLQAFIAAWHGRRTPVPYKQAVAILAGVRVVCVYVCVCVWPFLQESVVCVFPL